LVDRVLDAFDGWVMKTAGWDDGGCRGLDHCWLFLEGGLLSVVVVITTYQDLYVSPHRHRSGLSRITVCMPDFHKVTGKSSLNPSLVELRRVVFNSRPDVEYLEDISLRRAPTGGDADIVSLSTQCFSIAIMAFSGVLALTGRPQLA